MRIQEVILKESFSEEQLLLPCYAGEVKDAKDTSRLLRLLGDAAPLQLFGVGAPLLSNAITTFF